jgi:hypothetical protein
MLLFHYEQSPLLVVNAAKSTSLTGKKISATPTHPERSKEGGTKHLVASSPAETQMMSPLNLLDQGWRHFFEHFLPGPLWEAFSFTGFLGSLSLGASAVGGRSPFAAVFLSSSIFFVLPVPDFVPFLA